MLYSCYILKHLCILKSFLSFQLFYADEAFQVFAVRVSEKGMIYFMVLDGRKGIQSVKSA